MALDDRRLDEAVEGLQEATRNYPDRWQVWFDLGLAHKLRRDWVESVAASRRAAELGQAKESYFNLGVAATAIRDWDTARYAWRGLGIDVGTGPEPRGDFGLCPVRLNPDTDGEVVWGRRIDPCRIRIESVPLPESGHRWHDVVLHDVVPAGRRTLDGHSLPVFESSCAWTRPMPRPSPWRLSRAPGRTVTRSATRSPAQSLGSRTGPSRSRSSAPPAVEAKGRTSSTPSRSRRRGSPIDALGLPEVTGAPGDTRRLEPDGLGRDIVAFEQVG